LAREPLDPMNEPLRCERCDNSFLYEMKLSQFKAFHNVILGQTIPKVKDINFVAYLCPKCGNILLPSLEPGRTDQTWKLYEQMEKELGKDDLPLPPFPKVQ